MQGMWGSRKNVPTNSVDCYSNSTESERW